MCVVPTKSSELQDCVTVTLRCYFETHTLQQWHLIDKLFICGKSSIRAQCGCVCACAGILECVHFNIISAALGDHSCLGVIRKRTNTNQDDSSLLPSSTHLPLPLHSLFILIEKSICHCRTVFDLLLVYFLYFFRITRHYIFFYNKSFGLLVELTMPLSPELLVWLNSSMSHIYCQVQLVKATALLSWWWRLVTLGQMRCDPVSHDSFIR